MVLRIAPVPRPHPRGRCGFCMKRSWILYTVTRVAQAPTDMTPAQAEERVRCCGSCYDAGTGYLFAHFESQEPQALAFIPLNYLSHAA